MAFPVVESTAESGGTTQVTAHTVTIPAGGAAAGQLLLTLFAVGTATTAPTLNDETGWVRLIDTANFNDLKILYRWTDGSEGSTQAWTSTFATRTSHITYRISGAENPSTQPPEVSAVGTGTSTTPDMPSHTPTGGAKDYLWIVGFALAGEEVDDDTWCNSAPTDYTNLLQKSGGITGTNQGGLLASARRELNASTENPATFSIDVSLAWRARTIAIHPAPPVPDKHVSSPLVVSRRAVGRAAM